MEKKWNLGDIKPAEKRRPPSRPARSMESEEPAPRVAKTEKKPKGNRKGVFYIIAAVLLLAIAGVAVAALTGKTVVTVFPKFREPTVNSVFEAKREAGSGELAYELMTLEAEGAREVSATGQEEVEEQATGEITIYNTGSESQRLITNTRFETEDRKVFRISDPAVIPAASGGTPGMVTVGVFADQAGPEYNLPAGTRLRVAAFRENNQNDLYQAVYAENATSLSGGHKGPKFIIDDAELTTVKESLHEELRQALAARVASERPAGFALYDSSITYTYQTLPAEDLGGGKVRIKEKAILQAPVFNNSAFASFIAAATVPGYDGESVRLVDNSALTFSYATSTVSLGGTEPITFKLLGKPQVVWTYDMEQLKEDLAGGSQTALNTVLGGYPAIEKATATIKPFWKRSFPDDPKDIEIKEELSAN